MFMRVYEPGDVFLRGNWDRIGICLTNLNQLESTWYDIRMCLKIRDLYPQLMANWMEFGTLMERGHFGS